MIKRSPSSRQGSPWARHTAGSLFAVGTRRDAQNGEVRPSRRAILGIGFGIATSVLLTACGSTKRTPLARFAEGIWHLEVTQIADASSGPNSPAESSATLTVSGGRWQLEFPESSVYLGRAGSGTWALSGTVLSVTVDSAAAGYNLLRAEDVPSSVTIGRASQGRWRAQQFDNTEDSTPMTMSWDGRTARITNHWIVVTAERGQPAPSRESSR